MLGLRQNVLEPWHRRGLGKLPINPRHQAQKIRWVTLHPAVSIKERKLKLKWNLDPDVVADRFPACSPKNIYCVYWSWKECYKRVPLNMRCETGVCYVNWKWRDSHEGLLAFPCALCEQLVNIRLLCCGGASKNLLKWTRSIQNSPKLGTFAMKPATITQIIRKQFVCVTEVWNRKNNSRQFICVIGTFTESTLSRRPSYTKQFLSESPAYQMSCVIGKSIPK